MRTRLASTLLAATCLLSIAAAGTTAAQVRELRVAKQHGIGYLPLMVMEHDKLIEKHVKAAGLGDVTVKWATFAGAAPMNDALLSGNLEFGAVGTTSIPLLWARTKGTPQEVRAVCSLSSVPLFLNTRDPAVKSIADFTDRNRIALPAVKISTMALVLQMAAAKTFGPENYARLDHLTISRSHPDAMVALLSGTGEIDSHFTWPPFQYRELENPNVRTVLNSYDVTDGPATTVAMIATSRFREANPKIVAAFVAAMNEANALIGRDVRRAAQIYIDMTRDPDSVDNIARMLKPEQFTTTPQKTMLFAEFLHRVGGIKEKPGSWKDMFFPEAHGLPGS